MTLSLESLQKIMKISCLISLHYFPFPLWITTFKGNVLYVNPDIKVKRSCCHCTPWRHCMVSHSIHTTPLSSRKKHSWYPLNRRPGGPQSCCGHFVEWQITYPYLKSDNNSLVVKPVAQFLASYIVLTNYLFVFYRIYFIPFTTFLILRNRYF